MSTLTMQTTLLSANKSNTPNKDAIKLKPPPPKQTCKQNTNLITQKPPKPSKQQTLNSNH